MYRAFAIFAVVALAVGALLLGRGVRMGDRAGRVEPEIEQPGYSAREAEIVETGPNGRPRYRLQAERIEQRPREGSIVLEKLSMTYRTEEGSDWRLTAERGRMPQSARSIELEGTVRVTGLVPGTREIATIASERLAFDTVTERVTTEDPVTLDWSGHRLTARGLVADLKAQTLSLESDVNGRFRQ